MASAVKCEVRWQVVLFCHFSAAKRANVVRCKDYYDIVHNYYLLGQENFIAKCIVKGERANTLRPETVNKLACATSISDC